jgi:cytochrome c
MSRFPKLLTAVLAFTLAAAPVLAEGLGLGRPATEAEIEAWDLDIRPDGTGLPPGSGSVAEGVDNWPELAGGEDTLADEDPVKTVGSYWPYLSTAWDYVHRSMPYGNAQSLTYDETYALVAYILYSNFLVEDDFVLSNENFLEVEMPNADGFIVDDRPDTEYARFSAEPCMTDCKDSVEITMRARVLDVTPEDDSADAALVGETEVIEAAAPAGPDPALVAAGEDVFKRCAACHQVGEGAKNRVGPHLNGIVGQAAGAVEGFRYSKALEERAGEGLVWDAEALKAFLADPRGYLPRTKMAFPGLRSDEDLAAVVAYLETQE